MTIRDQVTSMCKTEKLLLKQPIVLESNQNHATITNSGICPALPASMGMGGGYIPMITEDGMKKIYDWHRQDTRMTELQNVCTTVAQVWGSGGNNMPYVLEEEEDMTYGIDSYNQTAEEETEPTLKINGGGDSIPKAEHKTIVRRLTPEECERLQGFPDGWTDIGEWTDSKGKVHKPADSPRYKALGNSIAIPFWFVLLRRISAIYERPATLGSLFDGIGGFPYCWEKCNGKGTALWASEIEEFPMAVSKVHFPEIEK